jgi:hypothetical protein
MIAKDLTSLPQRSKALSASAVLRRFQVVPWEIVIAASFLAGIGNGWTALIRQSRIPSPFLAAVTMMLATFAGWYVWGFFTHLIDRTFFGDHADYQGVLDTFWRAYVFQALSLLTFIHPMGWLWTWIASYATIVAWGIVGPRRLGMKTWQALVSATLGMLMWLACLVALTLTLKVDGLYIGIGAFLV